MESDFVSEEPQNLEGMVNLYKNIGSYLGSKETNFDKSVLKCKFESQSLFVIVRKSADQASTRIYSVSVDF